MDTVSGRCGHFLVLAKQPDQGSSGSVKKFVSLVKNGSFLVRIKI